jgi:hypothetical protein
MPKTRTITPEKISKVKDLVQRNSIRAAAKYAGISFYTAWCIVKGKYEDEQPLQPQINFNRCFITGFKL